MLALCTARPTWKPRRSEGCWDKAWVIRARRSAARRTPSGSVRSIDSTGGRGSLAPASPCSMRWSPRSGARARFERGGGRRPLRGRHGSCQLFRAAVTPIQLVTLDHLLIPRNACMRLHPSDNGVVALPHKQGRGPVRGPVRGPLQANRMSSGSLQVRTVRDEGIGSIAPTRPPDLLAGPVPAGQSHPSHVPCARPEPARSACHALLRCSWSSRPTDRPPCRL